MKRIKLKENIFALVDDEDFIFLSKRNWFLSKSSKSNTPIRVIANNWGGGKHRNISMHQEIAAHYGWEIKGKLIDHKNRNPLDNRKSNLRISNKQLNAFNSKIKSTNTSGYRGVYFNSKNEKWIAQININKKPKYLGSFDTSEEAALCYNSLAKKLYGEHANLNKILNKSNPVGLICCRLQPLHLGHSFLIKSALKRCKQVIVAVGSSQESRTERNPFTFEERKQMLENVFGKELKRGRLKIIKLIDINDPPNWVAYVLKEIKNQLGDLAITDYFAGTVLDASLFNENSKFCVHINQRFGESGTSLRKKIKSGDLSWRSWIPEENIELVTEVLCEQKK